MDNFNKKGMCSTILKVYCAQILFHFISLSFVQASLPQSIWMVLSFKPQWRLVPFYFSLSTSFSRIEGF